MKLKKQIVSIACRMQRSKKHEKNFMLSSQSEHSFQSFNGGHSVHMHRAIFKNPLVHYLTPEISFAKVHVKQHKTPGTKQKKTWGDLYHER